MTCLCERRIVADTETIRTPKITEESAGQLGEKGQADERRVMVDGKDIESYINKQKKIEEALNQRKLEMGKKWKGTTRACWRKKNGKEEAEKTSTIGRKEEEEMSMMRVGLGLNKYI